MSKQTHVTLQSLECMISPSFSEERSTVEDIMKAKKKKMEKLE
jgi:hypothetical protein